MIKKKLGEFSGYTSIHGIGRLSDASFILQKIFWCCICLGSFSMCVFQIYRLILQYTSESVNTQLSTSYTPLAFPSVTFCNLNPLSYAKMKKEAEFWQIVNETSHAVKLDISFLRADITPAAYGSSLFPVPPYDPGPEPLKSAKEVFHLRMGQRGQDTIYDLSQPLDKFLIECSYQGKKCNQSEIVRARDEYYGACYKFTPTTPVSSLAGPSFALDLLFDVHQNDYVPFVADFAGIRMGIHRSEFKPILTSEGFSISTGMETNIALRQKRFVRFARKDGSGCDTNNTYSGILPCMEACIGYEVAKKCDCLSSWSYKTKASQDMCATTTQIACMRIVEETATGTANCDCKMPCKETTFEKDTFLTSFPAENYEFVLQETLNTSSANIGSLANSLVKVKVFFGSLVEDIITEELAYTDENFVSDIGGQLGLWAGFSVLSLAELLELTIILFHACCAKKKAEVSDYEKD